MKTHSVCRVVRTAAFGLLFFLGAGHGSAQPVAAAGHGPDLGADLVGDFGQDFRWWWGWRDRHDQRGTPPTITTQPVSQTVALGAAVTFTVEATGTAGELSYHWYKNGWPIPAANTASYTITAAVLRSAGTYACIVRDDAGWIRSAPATLSVVSPALTLTGPASQVVDAGTDVTFSITGGTPDLTYQWRFNGRKLPDATAATLEIPNAGTTKAGTYMAIVYDATGPQAVFVASLQINTDARLANLSTRGLVGTGAEVLIVGFVIRGEDEKQMLLRGVGPTLGTNYSVPNALATPTLTLYRRGEQLATNSGWGGTAELAQTFLDVGAFALPADSLDAALLQPLGAGAYTAHVTGANDATGIALAEIYDADTGSPGTELINISARAFVGTGDEGLVAGFIIAGNTSETVLIRGVGPTLKRRWGFHRALDETKITVYDADGNVVAEKAAWDDDEDVTECNDHVGAFHFDPRSRDSAILATLPPGAYTAIVTGVNNTTGLALVEVYEVR